jgi:serine phosphatase RsbU (regulator of sigma subunit)
MLKPSTSKIYPRLYRIAAIVWPDLDNRSTERQMIGVGEVISTLYSIPFALTGLIWLILVTDFDWLQGKLGYFLLFAALVIIFNRLGFFLIIELRQNRYGSTEGALTGVPVWSGALLFGPTFFWLPTFYVIFQFVRNWQRSESQAARWGQVRNITMNLTSETLVPLIALAAYRWFGGQYPFKTLTVESILLALVMFGVHLLAYTLFWGPYLAYHAWAQQILTGNKIVGPIVKFFLLAIALPQVANPFAILAAGLYSQSGIWVFLYFVIGMIAVAYLTRRLSWSAERSRQSSRILEKLETLGRAIIDAPPDSEDLPQILQDHITNMFPAGRLIVWIFPEDILVRQPEDWTPNLESIWPWLLDQTTGQAFLSDENLPWLEEYEEHNPVVIAPISEVETSQTFGGIFLEFHTLAQPWDRKALQNLCPAVQALAAQIASAINQAKSYQRALELHKVNEEIKLAGNIQASLLPYIFPDMPGYQVAVTLDPAGETSGDFFDIIPLEGGKIGFLIADVLDKGLGPALYMTLSRTLIRTYATEFDLQPDLVFFATNERILKDTRANLFVTVFFAVLDPKTGSITYCNAGHNPPFLLSSQNECEPHSLTKTGIPIGIDEDSTWERETVLMEPGDVLVLYTDGVPDAQNSAGDFYKQQSLVDTITNNLGQSAEDLQTSILDSVYEFVGEAPPFDDITLMVLARDLENEEKSPD